MSSLYATLDERTKGKLILCPSLEQTWQGPVCGCNLNLKGVLVPENPVFSADRLWFSVLRQLYWRYPVFFVIIV